MRTKGTDCATISVASLTDARPTAGNAITDSTAVGHFIQFTSRSMPSRIFAGESTATSGTPQIYNTVRELVSTSGCSNSLTRYSQSSINGCRWR